MEEVETRLEVALDQTIQTLQYCQRLFAATFCIVEYSLLCVKNVLQTCCKAGAELESLLSGTTSAALAILLIAGAKLRYDCRPELTLERRGAK